MGKQFLIGYRLLIFNEENTLLYNVTKEQIYPKYLGHEIMPYYIIIFRLKYNFEIFSNTSFQNHLTRLLGAARLNA